MFVARWNGHEIARSEVAILVENTLYLPPDSLRPGVFAQGEGSSHCSWKGGDAVYFDVRVSGATNPGAAWSYPETADMAGPIQGWFGFWKGIVATWEGQDAGKPLTIDHFVPAVAKALGLGADQVLWRPDLDIPGLPPRFMGYRILSPKTLVDVLAVSGNQTREQLIGMASERARALARYNVRHPKSAQGYIAVWGSSEPSARALEAVQAGSCVTDLVHPAEIIEP